MSTEDNKGLFRRCTVDWNHKGVSWNGTMSWMRVKTFHGNTKQGTTSYPERRDKEEKSVCHNKMLLSPRVCGRWGSGVDPGRVAWEGESERNLVPGLLCSDRDLPRRQVDSFSALYEYGCDRRRTELRN